MRTLVKVIIAVMILTVPVLWAQQYMSRETMSLPLFNRLIVIDPGHGGVDPGSSGLGGVREKDIVLSISLKLRTLLQSSGALVVMTREIDTDLSDESLGNQYSKRKRQDMERRVDIINDSGADILLSIHVNAIGSSRWSGGQVFYTAGSEQSKLLAQSIQSSFKNVLKNTERTAATGNYFIIRESEMPSVIVEAGFLSNVAEAKLLVDDNYQHKVAWAIYLGLLEYYASSGK